MSDVYDSLIRSVSDMTEELHSMNKENETRRSDRWVQYIPIMAIAISGFYYAVKMENSIELNTMTVQTNQKNIEKVISNIDKLVDKGTMDTRAYLDLRADGVIKVARLENEIKSINEKLIHIQNK